jgi:2-C-methyl-D-erythritol 4-phosphate cytidylyltransferase/2-C-methyl-D-erythritol 2,4-cyclodiphosphate synthase
LAGLRPVERIVIVTAAERVEDVRGASWLPERSVVVAGRDRRQESVAAGVAEIERGDRPDDRVVLIHDGARPAVGADLVARVIEAATAHGAAIPILPLVETVKQVDDDVVTGTVDRTGLGIAQTPQGVQLGILRRAYERFAPDGDRTFTDEASLLEACTIPVRVVPGQVDNLKVTVPVDLDRAAAVLLAERPRVGFGEDTHPFGPGAPLTLGGIVFDGAPRLAGHSDGDVVLHAVADALLGAAGLGDLGRLFPSDERTPRGIASSALLGEVMTRVTTAGLVPSSVDVTIIGARPRLGTSLDTIRDRIAGLLRTPSNRVNVKASTGNLTGDEGAGRAISARAVVTLELTR